MTGRVRMLCLTRKAGETIAIGDAVVSIHWVRGDKVRVGVEAPGEMKVLRGELEPRIKPQFDKPPHCDRKAKKGGGRERA